MIDKDLAFYIQKDCTAFDKETIGSKVFAKRPFLEALYDAIQEYDYTKDEVPGQSFVVLPKEVHQYVLSGDGKKTNDVNDYIIRCHREGPKMFLKRSRSGEVSFCAVVLYNKEAFLNDPDITEEEAKFLASGKDYAIVAVIASSGPSPTVSPFRFVHNLAGGNHEYYRHFNCKDEYHKHMEWLHKKAKEALKYTNEYTTVAD